MHKRTSGSSGRWMFDNGTTSLHPSPILKRSCCLLPFPPPPEAGYGLCVPCAVATARHRLDGSSWWFNLFCLNLCGARNVVRHGYGIKVRSPG